MSINIKAGPNRVVIRPLNHETAKESPIVLPESAKQKPTRGEIVAIGSSAAECTLDAKVGDIVHFAKWGGAEIDHQSEKLVVIKQDEILAIEIK